MAILNDVIRPILVQLIRLIIVSYYRIMGPPNVLIWGIHTNAKILKTFGAKVGTNARIIPPLIIANAKTNGGFQNLSIGDNCIVGGNVFLDLTANITLEDHVSLGPGVIIMTHNQYNHNTFLQDRLASSCGAADVTLEKWASIKAGALIVHGVTIGEEAVVAGHAVVNQNVPSRHFVGGIPAKTIKDLNE